MNKNEEWGETDTSDETDMCTYFITLKGKIYYNLLMNNDNNHNNIWNK